MQNLLNAKRGYDNLTDSLQLQLTNSYIKIATIQNEYESVDDKYKSSIKLMKIPIVAEI
jgi:hypothetical protein